MSRSLVSILLPCRDADDFLRPALASIRRQTLRDWELIAVDDGSRDGTARILERAAASDSRIQFLRTPHRGIIGALQAALQEAQGDLIARMDADDRMKPQRLTRQLRAMDGRDVLATRVTVPFSPGMAAYVEWQNGLLTHEEIVHNLFVDCPIAHPSVMMRRAALESAGGYRETGWAEDFDLWHRMALNGARFDKLPEVLLVWSDRPSRLTRTHPMYSEKSFFEAKKYYLLRHPFLRPPVTIWGAGPIGRRWARDLLASGIQVEAAIDIDRKKIGRKICVNRVPVVSPEEGLSSRRGVLLGAVGSRGARAIIRERLVRADLREGLDFLFVA